MIDSNSPKYFESAELIRGKRVDDMFGKLHHAKRGAVSIELMRDIAKARVKQEQL